MEVAPLKFGGRVKFTDRWAGTVRGVDITEDWEVANAYIEAGMFFWKTEARLPFAAAKEWGHDHVAFGCTSMEAFGRQVAPAVVPARRVSAGTPVSVAAVSLVGFLVRAADRKVVEVLLRHGAHVRRASVTDVGFEGKTLAIGHQPEALPIYISDEEIAARWWEAVVNDRLLMGDERRELSIGVSNGRAMLRGNVRTKPGRERVAQLAAGVMGVLSVTSEVVDDLTLEERLGRAIVRAGLQRPAEVYVRSSLGDVGLWGYAPSQRVIEEVSRTVERVPGVRAVRNRMQLRPPGPPPAAVPAAALT